MGDDREYPEPRPVTVTLRGGKELVYNYVSIINLTPHGVLLANAEGAVIAVVPTDVFESVVSPSRDEAPTPQEEPSGIITAKPMLVFPGGGSGRGPH